MTVNAYNELVQYITQIFSHRTNAVQFVGDSSGDLVAQGITDYDYTDAELRQAVYDACENANVPADTRGALQSYTRGESGPPPHSGPATPADVVTHITYATQVVYDNDEYIQQTIIDQHQELNIDGDVHGDITQDNDPVNVMAGDGGTAVSEQGEGNANVISGDHSQGVGGDNSGQVAGEGAVVAGPGATIDGPIMTGGTFTGVQADGPVTNSVVGNNNQSAQVNGDAQDAVFNFGGGTVTDVSGSPGAVTAVGGDATNQIGNTVTQGGALSSGGDATGHYEDNDQDNDTTTTSTDVSTDVSTVVETHSTAISANDHSNVSHEDGEGDQHSQQDASDDFADAP
jgi:hypothetical protein